MKKQKTISTTSIIAISLIGTAWLLVVALCILEAGGFQFKMESSQVDKFVPFKVSLPVLDFAGDTLNFEMFENGSFTTVITNSGILDFQLSTAEMFKAEE